MDTFRAEGIRQRKIRLAWKEYNDATKGLDSNSPHYRNLERKAWRVLQSKLAQAR